MALPDEINELNSVSGFYRTIGEIKALIQDDAVRHSFKPEDFPAQHLKKLLAFPGNLFLDIAHIISTPETKSILDDLDYSLEANQTIKQIFEKDNELNPILNITAIINLFTLADSDLSFYPEVQKFIAVVTNYIVVAAFFSRCYHGQYDLILTPDDLIFEYSEIPESDILSSMLSSLPLIWVLQKLDFEFYSLHINFDSKTEKNKKSYDDDLDIDQLVDNLINDRKIRILESESDPDTIGFSKNITILDRIDDKPYIQLWADFITLEGKNDIGHNSTFHIHTNAVDSDQLFRVYLRDIYLIAEEVISAINDLVNLWKDIIKNLHIHVEKYREKYKIFIRKITAHKYDDSYKKALNVKTQENAPKRSLAIVYQELFDSILRFDIKLTDRKLSKYFDGIRPKIRTAYINHFGYEKKYFYLKGLDEIKEIIFLIDSEYFNLIEMSDDIRTYIKKHPEKFSIIKEDYVKQLRFDERWEGNFDKLIKRRLFEMLNEKYDVKASKSRIAKLIGVEKMDKKK